MPDQPEKDEAVDSHSDADRHVELAEGELESDSELERLVTKLERGNLTQEQQQELSKHLQIEPAREQHIHQRVRQTSFSGPLPHPDILNQFDEETRRTIVQMAVDDQKHVHEMNKTGLSGSILKDRRGQLCGVTIAVVGLIAAVLIAPYSAFAAGIIGTLDLFGMVALFVAPRVLEGRRNKKAVEDSESEDDE
ncbi:hypothetical protein EHLJMEHL_02195 [Vreelandella titanicae]|jgi:uncharacterized membrane protein